MRVFEKLLISIIVLLFIILYSLILIVGFDLFKNMQENKATIDDLGVVYIWLDEQGNILKAEYDNLEIEVLLKSHLLNDYCKLTPQCEEI